MGEAMEDKRLLVLSSLTWTVAVELPVRIGPRHFRAKSLDVLMDKIGAWMPVKGDRVQVCLYYYDPVSIFTRPVSTITMTHYQKSLDVFMDKIGACMPVKGDRV